MGYEIVVPVEIAYVFYILILGIIMYFVYLALFLFLFTHTKNPFLNNLFGFVLESLWMLFPNSWKKEIEKIQRENAKKLKK